MGNPSGEDVAHRSGICCGQHPRRFGVFELEAIPDRASRRAQPRASSAEKVDAIANTVPEDIKSSGKLIVGVNIPYAPNEFKDPSGKIVGFDVDLMNAVAPRSA